MFEKEYLKLVSNVLLKGEMVNIRNGKAIKVNGTMLKFNASQGIPILQSRKYYYKGVFGEFAAFIRGPKKLEDFVKWECNYWKIWADLDSTIKLDYGNTWIDWYGINQVKNAIKILKSPLGDGNRRVIITAWDPSHISDLSLPCCHYSYQFIRNGEKLSLIWIQRSADLMLGVPADALLAWIFLTSMANTCELYPHEIVMQFGDTHIYEEHIDNAKELLNRPIRVSVNGYNTCKDIFKFVPDDIIVDEEHYKPYPALKFELKE